MSFTVVRYVFDVNTQKRRHDISRYHQPRRLVQETSVEEQQPGPGRRFQRMHPADRVRQPTAAAATKRL